MFRWLSILLLLLLSVRLQAQQQDSVISGPADSIPKEVEKKPRIIREWTLTQDYSAEKEILFDTVFSFTHRHRAADKYSPINATLGNYGLPFYQISFFDRISDPDKFLYANYYPLMFLPDKPLFMNTQVPYTELDWTFAGPRQTSEQTFRVRHSQNVNRYLNFGIIYDIIFDLGQYNYQRAEDKDFTLYSSYTGDKYKLYFSAAVNNITSHENGGITNDEQLKIQTDTRSIPVNLEGNSNAVSVLKNRNLLLVQRYTIGGKTSGKPDSLNKAKTGFFGLSGTFSHILTIDGNSRTYSDKAPQSKFYDSVFFVKGTQPLSVTFDSLYSRNIKNTIRFDFSTDETRKFRLGGGAGIKNEIFRYSQIIPTHDTGTVSDKAVWRKSNNAVVGKLFNSIGDKFNWVANGELYLTGYRMGDFDFNGTITKIFDWRKGRASWLITGDMSGRQPSFWYQRWGSNHFEWNTNLKKELRINVGTSFSYPARKADFKFNYAIIDNYTDFDTTAHPSQHTGGLSVAAMTLSKDMHVWKFHLAADVIFQKSSNPEVLDLPFIALKSAGYFEHLFRFKSTGGRMNTQLGADLLWTSLYHPYSYMPATGRFYRQDAEKAGNYPFINVFFNFKVKRTRVFVMFDHVNSGMMGYNYYMVPHYPMNTRMLRYGLSWTFYD